MKQLKVIKGEGLLYRLSQTQSLNRTEIATLQRENNGAFLPISVREMTKTSVMFSAKGLIGLSDFLEDTVLSKRLFLHIVSQFLRVLKAADLNRLNKSLIVFDSRYIYIDPLSWQIRFVYLPVQPVEESQSCREALKHLLAVATFDSGENMDYVKDFFCTVRDESLFSALHMDSFVQRHKQTFPEENTLRCRQCGYALSAADTECPMCKTPCSEPANGRSGPDVQRVRADTTPYTVGEDGTGRISLFKVIRENRMPKLILHSTSGDVSVKRTPFRLGKQTDLVDLCLKNHAVSRRHAEILYKQGSYCIVDLHSTNGTYINGRRIPAGYEAKLQNRDSIMLGNEALSVYIEEE